MILETPKHLSHLPAGKEVPKYFRVALGDTFTNWTVASPEVMCTVAKTYGKTRWVYYALCDCTCGQQDWVNIDNMKRGLTRSCGCEASKARADASRTHGMSHTPIYAVWNMMQQRVCVPTSRAFKDYGGRGIDMDPRWLKFENFYADRGDPPFKGATLERVINDLGYWPTNVVWASRYVQGRNKRNTVRYEYMGHNLTIGKWSAVTGIKSQTLASRLYLYKWDIQKAVTAPITDQGHVAVIFTPNPIPLDAEEVANILYGQINEEKACESA